MLLRGWLDTRLGSVDDIFVQGYVAAFYKAGFDSTDALHEVLEPIHLEDLGMKGGH